MKALWIALCLSVIVFTSTVQADFPETLIATGTGLANPDIDGDLVAWQSGATTATTDIYWKWFNDPNDPNTVSITGAQLIPTVSGSIVVWEDQRLGTSDTEIYWQNVMLLGDSSYPMGLTLTNRQKEPAISGDIMVFQDRRSGDAIYDIYAYNKLTDTHIPVCTVETSCYKPAVSNNSVVWMDTRDDGFAGPDIYVSTISGESASEPVAVSPSNLGQYNPAIDGNIMVWEEEIVSGTKKVVAYDLSVPGIIWARTVSTVDACPNVSGNIVVWQQIHEGRSDHDIVGHDLSSEDPDSILEIATNPLNDSYADDSKPAVSGRKVVWQRNGDSIVGTEIALAEPTAEIAVLAPNGGEMFLAGSEMLITWGHVSGTMPAQVDIEFLNNGSEPEVIAENVSFTEYEYLWSPIADVNSIDACSIRITDADNPAVSDLSDDVFSIFQCDQKLTADLTGDCFVDIADFAELARHWLVCGNLYDDQWCFE